MKLRKFIRLVLERHLSESFIDDDGRLRDFDPSPQSDDLWSDEQFLEFVNDNLENGSEMPQKLYDLLSDNHKALYRKELLSYGGQMAGYSENKSLLRDLMKFDYNRLAKETMEWIDLFPEMGDNGFPVGELFIKSIDEILQGRIIERLIDSMDWEIHLSYDLFKSFHPRVQKMIVSNRFPFLIDQGSPKK